MQSTTFRDVVSKLVLAVALAGPACTRAPETAPADKRAVEVERERRDEPDRRGAERREPDVPYEPSPDHVVSEIVRLAELREGDVLYDLGCGDGRIVIAAVRTPGVRGVCVDIDPERIRESQKNARSAGVLERIEFRTEDLFESDIRAATVVTLFLWPKVNLKLRPKLERELSPGTRVISYMHDMGDWTPERALEVETKTRRAHIYLWRIGPRDHGGS